MTNFEKIKAMSVEKMARFLTIEILFNRLSTDLKTPEIDPAAARLILKFTGRKIFKNSYKKETFTDVQKITVEWLESEAAEND